MYQSKNSQKSKHKECRSLDIEKGGTGNYTRHTLRIGMLPRVSIRDVEGLKVRCREYFEICIEDDMKPTYAGFCLALGVARDTLRSIIEREIIVPDEARQLIEQCYLMLTAETEQFMVDGKINPVAGIFLMRNNMGYTNDEVATVKIESREQTQDVKALMKQAQALLEQKEGASE